MSPGSRSNPDDRRRDDDATIDQRAILFVDAGCLLCHRAARWVLARDGAGRIAIAPLQGETWRRLGGAPVEGDPETVVLRIDGESFERSDAVLRAWRLVGGIWGVAARLGRLVPRVVRDACYRFVARRRFRLFGRSAACALPSDLDRARVLP